MRLAILLTSGYEHQDHWTVIRLAGAAVRLGHNVDIFLMGDGVYVAPSLGSLSDLGANVVWCSHNADQRGLAIPAGVRDGSQLDWAGMVAEADRVVSFG